MNDTPLIACDMTSASDTASQRVDEYARLFEAAFIGRERTPSGIRWRLSAEPGIEAWARDLAARERACCTFMQITVSVVGNEVHWDASSIDDLAASLAIDVFFDLPDLAGQGVEAVESRLSGTGIRSSSTTWTSRARIGRRDP